ncbi:aminotransferase class I/II-fold pyridoxal phosphate-dependent enzyme [Pseudooceanicola nanhaiensis]|uniref:aminotransferase class I/II-fold pyridoxal phosphate-dependent enzyme n=1 Tax=Pseudooceanicola nanhaiensis TaxID=375761 RepID=UPI0040589649
MGRDHGGGIDAAAERFGGARDTWIDLSTGINPVPYPIPALSARTWRDLPDRAAQTELVEAARRFWGVPEGAAILPVPGLSAIIGRLPGLTPAGTVAIPGPTYNEYAPAFTAAGWQVLALDPVPDHHALVIVHPNNPDGRWHPAPPSGARLRVIDESFCDLAPDRSHIALAPEPRTLVLKSLGKFWGLGGLRLAFVIGDPEFTDRLSETLGPWHISGPAQEIGRRALADHDWATRTRARLAADAARMDRLAAGAGATPAGGTDLFRLYRIPNAAALRGRLARHRIWSRVFPWSSDLIRLGLPAPDEWDRVEAALA